MTKRTEKLWMKLTQVFLAVCTVFLGIELWLNTMVGTSLCVTESCRLADASLSIDKGWVIGAAIAWIISLVYCLTRDGLKKHQVRFMVVLLAGVAFEGVLVGNLIATNTFCLLCIIVAGIVAMVLTLVSVRKAQFGLLGVVTWLAAMAGSFFLFSGQPDITKPFDLTESAYTTFVSKEQKPTPLEFHLFFRWDCPVCQEVMDTLEQAENLKGVWYMHHTGLQLTELEAMKMAFSIDQAKEHGISAMAMAKGRGPDFKYEVDDELKKTFERQTIQSYQHIARMGVHEVPTLIVRGNDGVTILPGLKKILKWLVKNKAL